MAITTEARQVQLHGKYANLDTDNLMVGEMAIPEDHPPVARANNDTVIEFLTSNDAERIEHMTDELNNALADVKQLAIDKVGINDDITSSVQTWSSRKIDNELNNVVTFSNASGTTLALDTAEGGIRVNRIEGKTHKSKNLLDTRNLTTQTINGVTFTPVYGENGLEYITANGTASGNAVYVLTENNWGVGNSLHLCGCPSGGSTTTYLTQITDSTAQASNDTGSGANITFQHDRTYRFNLRVVSGYTANNIIFKPMLTIDTTLTYADYEPYGMHSAGEMGLVDLGSLEWTYSTSNHLFSALIADRQPGINMICPIYTPTNATIANVQNMQIRTSPSDGTVFVRNDTYTDAETFKSAMQGVPLAYEVTEGATPSKRALVVEECGKNLWNEQWEVGSISDKGVNTVSATSFRSIGYIKVKPDTNYYHTMGICVYYYDQDTTFISLDTTMTSKGTLRTPVNCHYIRIRSFQSYGAKYNNDIAIIEGTSGDYIPYQGKTVLIPLTDTLKSVNDISDELIKVDDRWKEHRRFSIVDLGSLAWRSDGTSVSGKYRIVSGVIPNIKVGVNNIISNIYCAKYVANTATNIYLTVNGIAVSTSGTILVYDDNYNQSTDANAFKTAMSGVYLIYELATDTYTDCTDQEPFYELESYKDKTYIDTADGLATLDVTYGTNELLAATILDSMPKERNKHTEEMVDKLSTNVTIVTNYAELTDALSRGGSNILVKQAFDIPDTIRITKDNTNITFDRNIVFSMADKGFAFIQIGTANTMPTYVRIKDLKLVGNKAENSVGIDIVNMGFNSEIINPTIQGLETGIRTNSFDCGQLNSIYEPLIQGCYNGIDDSQGGIQANRIYGGRIEQNEGYGIILGSPNVNFFGTVIEGNVLGELKLVNNGNRKSGASLNGCYFEHISDEGTVIELDGVNGWYGSLTLSNCEVYSYDTHVISYVGNDDDFDNTNRSIAIIGGVVQGNKLLYLPNVGTDTEVYVTNLKFNTDNSAQDAIDANINVRATKTFINKSLATNTIVRAKSFMGGSSNDGLMPAENMYSKVLTLEDIQSTSPGNFIRISQSALYPWVDNQTGILKGSLHYCQTKGMWYQRVTGKGSKDSESNWKSVIIDGSPVINAISNTLNNLIQELKNKGVID